MSYVLYPRQEEVVAKMEDFIKSKSKAKPVFIAPVAFGKSLLIANLALRVEDYYFINICPNKELLEQNYEKYISYGNEASICSHSLGKKELGKVTFATIKTIDKFYSFYQDKKVVVVVDEAHLNSLKGSSLDTFIKRLPYVKVLGLTATGLRLFPTREGTMLQMMNKMYNCMFTMIGDVVQVQEVIKLNMWTPLSYRVENVDLSKLRHNTSGGDFTVKSLELYSRHNDIPSRCVAGVKSLIKEGRKTILIFVPSIADAEKIQSKLPNAVCVHSKTDKTVRKRAVESFKNGDLEVLVNVSCFLVGFDCPRLSAIIMARPTSSYTVFYQILGRGVRKFEGKKDCVVFDLSGNYNKFGGIDNLSYENKPEWGGWSAFCGDEIITDTLLSELKKPTKKTLTEHYNNEIEGLYKKENLDPVFKWGKYKGKSFSKAKKLDPNKFKGYITWMINQHNKGDFVLSGDNGKELLISIKRELKI